uniref:Thioesterase domain-containing protein n=1 Tax=Hemiselmis andersenii TaxID=464988 RepID=A0A6T8PQ54_HEMAN|mmetsp:Transcript_21148/g.48954  ORF Transcript_21148/g.48954 Transcript_21148/m.48954 type:complete len:199 (+) Transcript_21148:60-656(+)|eukprot:CAMPEP_0169427520 /NCGR_PEP_ID=MMETSP1042-20121227/818_1 /TAXON_ID=464988 /ORGANISM="Hemiselmis andersenii, Strain CCMP1180" /LENGTH=198 /DNA_ID=CAMNT_0009537591 /DNA_START=55 /DNA_END=651 /DNA_ORIENTATION=+
MMDAVLSTFLKPLIGILDAVRILLAVIVCILPIIFRYISKGKRAFSKLDELFIFMSSLPGGRFIFNRLLLWITSTYTETVRPTVTKLTPSGATVFVDNQVWMRNPFNSIHALALGNLAEMSTGLAVICATQHRKGVRAIPTRINLEYLKKARGRITATSKVALPSVSGPYDCVAELTNSQGEVVCKGTVTWQVSVKDS